MSELNRWTNIKRPYIQDDVDRLGGSLKIEHTLAKTGAEKLWRRLHSKNHNYVKALGALTGNQALQQAKAGLKSVYLSGWQVAGDANDSLEMYPDQSLYPYDSAPKLVEAGNGPPCTILSHTSTPVGKPLARTRPALRSRTGNNLLASF